MKRTQILALLLIALFALSMTGCAPKAEPQPYEAPIRAYEAMLNNPDATWHDAVKSAAGDFCSEELTQIATLMIRTGDTTDEIMTDRMLGEYRATYAGCQFSFAIASAEPMDDATLDHYRDAMQYDSSFFGANYDELQLKGAVDWESGLPLDETAEMEELCATLRDRMADCEITEGYVVKLIVTVSGGDLEQPEQGEDVFNIICVDGIWVIGDVFDNKYTTGS